MKEYIMLNIELRKKTNNDFEKGYFKMMHNAVFGKTMENVRTQKNIKLDNRESERIRLVSEPNYYSTKWFSENLLATEMKKINVKMNKPIYLGMTILDVSKILMYEF